MPKSENTRGAPQFDEEGYEIGYKGPDMEKMRIIRGAERERIIRKAKGHPLKRAIKRLLPLR